MPLNEKSRGMWQGGEPHKGKSGGGAKCTCQLEFQSLDITDFSLHGSSQTGQGRFSKNSWHCRAIVEQICIIIREDWGKLCVIFWLGCRLSCEMPCGVNKKFLAAQGGNFLERIIICVWLFPADFPWLLLWLRSKIICDCFNVYEHAQTSSFYWVLTWIITSTISFSFPVLQIWKTGCD